MPVASEHPDLTQNEVAVLCDVAPRAVRKAIEERVLSVGEARLPTLKRTLRKALGIDAVKYIAVMREVDWPMPIEGKVRIAKWLSATAPENIGGHLVLDGPLTLDAKILAPKIKEAIKRAERYRRARRRWLVSDAGIMGGTPGIKGTRMTVYSVLGRINAGETLDAIAEENPDIPREALWAAVIFAKANPMRGRPSGRPWARAA
ncbi:MAG TPA: DUF433 domain-containing protein [Alphaproteobacteria bacterium]